MKNLTSAFSLFDAIYCINLDTATERWETVQAEFARIGISERVIRFPAIASPDPGLGCYLSHRTVMEMAGAAGHQRIIIFEDDITFDLDQTDTFLASLEALQATQWDIFYPGSTWFLEDFPAVFPRKNLLRIIGCRSNHATAYTRKAFQKILAHLPEEIGAAKIFLRKQEALDLFSPRFLQPFLRVYAPTEPFCLQVPGWSSIKGAPKDYQKVMYDNFYSVKNRSRSEQIYSLVRHLLRIPRWWLKSYLKK